MSDTNGDEGTKERRRTLAYLATPLMIVGAYDLALGTGFESRMVGLLILAIGSLAAALTLVVSPQSNLGAVLSGVLLFVVYVVAFIAATRPDGSEVGAIAAGSLAAWTLVETTRARPLMAPWRELLGHLKPVGATIGALIGLLALFLSEFYIPTRSQPSLNADVQVSAAKASDGLVPLKVIVSATNNASSAVWVIVSLAELTVSSVRRTEGPAAVEDLESRMRNSEPAALYSDLADETLVAFTEPFPMGSWFAPGEIMTHTFAAYVPERLGNHVTVRVNTHLIPQRRLALVYPIIEEDATDEAGFTQSILSSRVVDSAVQSLWKRLLKDPPVIVAQTYVTDESSCSEIPTAMVAEPTRACWAVGFGLSSYLGDDALSDRLSSYLEAVNTSVTFSADLASLEGGT